MGLTADSNTIYVDVAVGGNAMFRFREAGQFVDMTTISAFEFEVKDNPQLLATSRVSPEDTTVMLLSFSPTFAQGLSAVNAWEITVTTGTGAKYRAYGTIGKTGWIND